jgi:hypothetical protein
MRGLAQWLGTALLPGAPDAAAVEAVAAFSFYTFFKPV